MSVLEIEAPSHLVRRARPAPERAVTVSPALLGLSSRPDFLPPAPPAGPGPTLWDTLRLSWTAPQTMRDLLGA